ncbi:hypothetical protein RSAG8_12328, partial [Rhizoctonia solani AG-8 WAC10335]
MKINCPLSTQKSNLS